MPKEKVKHAYVPDVHGKEKRKREPGKEGLLGVEGIKDDIILIPSKKRVARLTEVRRREKRDAKSQKPICIKQVFRGERAAVKSVTHLHILSEYL